MADKKISELNNGNAAQATDFYVVARSSNNFKISGANVAAAATSVGTLTSLTVSGVTTFSAGTAGAPALTTSGDTNTGIFFPAADTIAFAEGGTESMRLDASGNLGINATPKSWASTYKVVQIGQAGVVFAMTNDQDRVGITANAYFDTTDNRWEYIGSGLASRYEQNGGSHQWFITNSSGSGDGPITFTEGLRLTSTGNLLLDTVLDTGSFSRNIILNGSNSSGVTFRVGDAMRGFLFADATALTFGAPGGASPGIMIFKPHDVERMRVDNPTVPGQTALILYDLDNNAMERVTVGAADSGGTGFKVLRIPN